MAEDANDDAVEEGEGEFSGKRLFNVARFVYNRKTHHKVS